MEYREEVPLLTQLRRWFGFQSFKGNQEAAIRNLLQGRDTFVLMPTGGGKSLCYQLPALLVPGTAVVVSPLIALMKNQVDSFRGYHEHDGVAHFMNSSLSRKQITGVKKDILEGRTKLLYVAPESLIKEENVEFLKKIRVSFYAIDEAHCISEWGHDFRPEYRRIRPMIDAIGNAPVIALTATATPKVQEDILKNLEIEDAQVFKSSFNRPNLFYQIRPKGNATREIIRHIRAHSGQSGIIYCLSRKKVEQMAQVLQVNGIKALPYHAGMDTVTRSKHQDAFLQEQVDVIVATIAFGMGIDKPDVRYVMHYDMPKSLEGYYQETGRAGRDGGVGECIAFYCRRDIMRLEKFFQGKTLPEQEVSRQLLFDTIDYAEGGDCRRLMLLGYFGEKYEEENCGCCDNCEHPRAHFEAMDDALVMLQIIQKIGENFRGQQVVRILMGEDSPDTKMYEHYKLPEFGTGKEKGTEHWQSVLRQLRLHGYVNKEIHRYGMLRLTPKGEEFLINPHSLSMVEDHRYEEELQELQELEQEAMASDNVLLRMLQGLRRDMARKLDVPPFVIFQDPSLEEMTVQYPTTLDDLQYITGVTLGKAKRYGKPFVELIARYVEEQEIEPPTAVVMHMAPSQSQLKVQIIQCIDRKMDFEDIADNLHIDYEELLEEVESLVNSGVRLEVGYYVDQLVEEDIQEDIFDYFRTEATSDSFDEALEALKDEDITEEEIRLTRIRFLSDMAN